MKKIIVPAISTVLLVTSAVSYFIAPSESDLKELTGKEHTLVSQGYNSVEKYQESYTPPDASSSESKTEIEVSTAEILEADTEGLIGSNNPYNPRFITEDDVIGSISRILSREELTIDLFDEEYLDYVINLRHLEMTDLVTESDSKVLSVAVEYNKKLTNQQ